jgi:hypothetical protein
VSADEWPGEGWSLTVSDREVTLVRPSGSPTIPSRNATSSRWGVRGSGGASMTTASHLAASGASPNPRLPPSLRR